LPLAWAVLYATIDLGQILTLAKSDVTHSSALAPVGANP
jgi:hypothetical protein